MSLLSDFEYVLVELRIHLLPLPNIGPHVVSGWRIFSYLNEHSLVLLVLVLSETSFVRLGYMQTFSAPFLTSISDRFQRPKLPLMRLPIN